jgi:sulfatase modifying factor 1
MKLASRRPSRLRAWPLVLLAACGSVIESTRPAISPAEAMPVAAIEHERDHSLDADGSAQPTKPPSSQPRMSDVWCAAGVGEDVRIPPRACPMEMAHIAGYCIDRWEAHLVVRAGNEIRPHPYYLRPVKDKVYEARSKPGVFPQAYVSRVESKAACEAAGKRLCKWIEWRRGCQGTHWQRFPYGGAYEAEKCNHVKEHLLGRIFGHDARRWKQSQFNDPRLSQEPGFLSRSGEYEECVSPDGVYDMVGNLHEWVTDRVTVAFMTRIAKEGVYREKQPWRGGNGMFLGGFYSTRGQHGPGCHFTTAAHGPTYHDYSTGFRCCRDAQTEEEQ